VYGDKVRVVFRNFPLAMHQFAQKAAEAGECANEQGKFWEMHDSMFANQKALAVENLKQYATTIGLKADQFNACLDGGKYANAVQQDLLEGQDIGVSGTPAFFVNGRFLNGAVPYEEFQKIVDEELQLKGIPSPAKKG